MDATYVHLLINHIPILGSVFGVLLLLVGMILKNRTVEITALATLLAVAAFTIPAYVSGEEAEHTVEHLVGVSEWELEEHEEHAESSLWLMIATGVLALLTLLAFRFKEELAKWMRLGTVIIGTFAFLSMIPLALHGGSIIRSEMRTSVDDSPSDHEAHEDDDEHDH